MLLLQQHGIKINNDKNIIQILKTQIKMTQLEFFSKYSSDAITAMKQTGIPASVTLAQAAIESAWGAAAFQDNFFGIKAGSKWSGKTQLLRTTEVLSYSSVDEAKAHGVEFPSVIGIEPSAQFPGKYIWHIRDNFRAYDTPLEGFLDHANFFHVNSRYAEALKDENDAAKFADDIAKAGYSTTPNYAQVIIGVVNQYNLTQYDKATTA